MSAASLRGARVLLLGVTVAFAMSAVIAIMVPGIFTATVARLLYAAAVVMASIGWLPLVQIALTVMGGMVAWPLVACLRDQLRSARWMDEVRNYMGDLRAHAPMTSRRPRSLLTLPRARAMLPLFYAHLSTARRAARRAALEPGEIRWPPLLRPTLLFAIALSFEELVWRKPGIWEVSVLVGVATAAAVGRLRSHVVPSPPLIPGSTGTRGGVARRLASRSGAWRLSRRLPPGSRSSLGLLVLLNLLVGADFADLRLFVVMAAINLAALNHLARVAWATGREPAGGRDQSSPPVSLLGRSAGSAHAPSVPVQVSARRQLTPGGASSRDERVKPGRSLEYKVRASLAVTALIAAMIWIAYAHPGTWLVPAVLVLGFAVTSAASIGRDQAITMVLAVGITAAAIDYVSWRLQVTNWRGWWIAAPLLFAEVLGAIHVLGFQLTIWPRQSPAVDPSEDPTRQPIFILIPTLNEGVGVLRPTLDGCLSARRQYLAEHPQGRVTIAVCNDGRAAGVAGWEAIDALAARLGIRCVTRETGGGAKAGNLENGRRTLNVTGDALLVIFDADQVPSRDFLVKTVAPFGDPSVGWVQTGQYYANLDNPVSRWADDQQSLFYNLLCPGKAAMNAAFICGTNVVIRARALDEIGGFPQDSVTEDFAASIVLHRRWRSIYLPDVLATGLGPLDIASYLRQQGRWSLGTLGVFRTHWRDILLPRKGGLRLDQRAQYFLACTHYLCGLRDLIYLLSPLLFIATGVPAVQSATLTQYLWHFLPYGLLGLVGLWYAARGLTGLRGIAVGFGSFPTLIGSLVAVVLNRKVGFAVTSKRRDGRRPLAHVRIHILLVLLCLVGLVWVSQVTGQQATSLFISVFWILYSLILLGSFLWLAVADEGASIAATRAGVLDEVAAKVPYPLKLHSRAGRAKPAWSVGAATLMAAPVLVGGHLSSLPIFPARGVTPFVIRSEKPAPPFVGLSLPTSLLSRRQLLEHELGAPVSVIGRTQGIEDRFDSRWAQSLAARRVRPWITLEFGVFGRGHRRPPDASPPAIINGLHDTDIRRWADEIRDFGKPVYLTILRHADKNWSLTSGVTAGGIPEDVPRAWLHVQAIFRDEGATNVAWVWAPADPIDDQAFAPPVSSINLVLQSFVNYPRTPWGDPSNVLARLSRRYPGKPMFIEASVDGQPSAKAAWLTRLGDALDHWRQLYAFLYHEGGPALTGTSAATRPWSLASDPLSLRTIRGVVASLETERGFR